MTGVFSRLFQPKSVAVIGGGAWCRAVTEQLIKAEFKGDIWPVHPRADDICGLKAYPTAIDLPSPPDAAFVGINRDATIGAVERLARMGAGGAVCFASGFSEVDDGADANARLLKAAKDMPILGPNCYGFINALDGACLWPDQHGLTPVESGVAILTQSSNIAINLTMQKRGLPIAYMVTCGNQAQLSMAEIARSLLDDPRVTAIGLHIEGFGDLKPWQDLARLAYAKGVPLVAIKVGRSEEARTATISHTASLAGSDAGAQAVLNHLGIPRVWDLPIFLETLKLLHCAGHLPSHRIASISCSGGEASLMADLASRTKITFPPLTKKQRTGLSKALGPKVSLANPLDYHTYIWRDIDAMTEAFSAMIEPNNALTALIVDFPRPDRCDPSDWECVIEAARRTRAETGGRLAVIATLPELLPEDVAARLMADGVIPLNGLTEGLAAIEAAHSLTPQREDLEIPPPPREGRLLTEFEAKTALSKHGLSVPNGVEGDIDVVLAKLNLKNAPFVLKSIGTAHKSDTGGVVLNLTDESDIRSAAKRIGGATFLAEPMVTGAVAELLVGVVKDPAHGFVITIGAGGTLAEILDDNASILLPTSRDLAKQTLLGLKIAKLLTGYRGKPAANVEAIIDAIMAIQAYVLANIATIEEVEINPLIATQTGAIAVDALIRKCDD